MRALSSARVIRPPKVSSTCSSVSLRQRLAAPGSADQCLRAGAVALASSARRERKLPFGRSGLVAGEGADGGEVRALLPQHGLGAAAEHLRMRPARIGGEEGREAGECRRRCSSLCRIAHSTSLRAVGSSIRCSMSVASCALPRRANSRACLTVAMSVRTKLPLGAEGASSRGRGRADEGRDAVWYSASAGVGFAVA